MAEVNQESTFFFPLRTNVKYFDSPDDRLELVNRIKEAALLYDNLLFEGGMYQAVIWDDPQGHGKSYDSWLPPEFLEEEQEHLAREEADFKPSGGVAAVLIDDHVFASGPAERQFRAEFHTVLRKLDADELPWIKTECFQPSSEIKNRVARQLTEDETAMIDLFSAESKFLRTKIVNNLNLDLLLATFLGCAASVDPFYEPFFARKASSSSAHPAPGFTALRIAVPNVVAIPWNEIVDLRDEICLKEFRTKLQEVEDIARESAICGDDENLDLRIAQLINLELLHEIDKWLPKTIDVVEDVSMDLVVGVVPGLSAAITAASGIGEVKRARKSWVTAFLKLHPKR